MKINKNLTDPSKVTFGRFDTRYGHFRYDGKRYKFTGCVYLDESQLDDGTWLNHNSPVYQEYLRQAKEVHEKQTQKAEMKRQQLLVQKKIEAMNNTMTAFEWRVKLLTEHRLYLSRRPYGCGDFEVFSMNSIGGGAINYKGKQILRDKLDYDRKKLCNYSPYKVYSDESIQCVLDKVAKAAKMKHRSVQIEIEKALKKM